MRGDRGGVDVQRYRERGYLFPLAALAPDELARFRRGVDHMVALMGGRATPSESSQCHLHFPWAYQLSTHARILDAVEAVIGSDILVHSTTLFCKQPGSPSFVSWHQDGHYWGLTSPRLVSAWIALSDSTVDNGCMRVVPGSHLSRVEHVEVRDANNMLASGITICEGIDEREALDVVLAAGQMSMHHPNLIHGSNPNLTSSRRIGFAIRYVAPDVRQIPEHHEVVLARGRDRHNHYRQLQAAPSSSPDECLAVQIGFAARLRRLRRAQGRVG